MISINLHNLRRPTYRIHNRALENNLWMAFELPDAKGNTVTLFIDEPDELRALVEVAQEALVQFERRVAILAALNAPEETRTLGDVLSVEKALGPVGVVLMKVKDLIKRLERFDTDSTVAIIDNHWVGAVSTDPIVTRTRIDVVGDSLLHKGEVSDSAESVVLITFRGAHA